MSTFIKPPAESGAEDGHAAATWVFDGNSTPHAYKFVLGGLEDGDPLVLDALPQPPEDIDFTADQQLEYDLAFCNARDAELYRVCAFHLDDESEGSHGQGHFVGGLITDESPGGVRFVEDESENA